MTHVLGSLITKSKPQIDRISELSSTCSNKNTNVSSVTNATDWHRVLLSRLKPGITGKYRTRRRNSEGFDALGSLSFDDSNVRLRSYTNDSYNVDSRQIFFSQSDTFRQLDSLDGSSMKRDNHYVKNSFLNRSRENMTTLKRRVRKQQMRNVRNQTTILHESTFQLPSPTDLFLVSYREQTSGPPVPPRRYRPKNTSRVVPLPPLVNAATVTSTTVHGVKRNLYGY